MKFFLSVCIVFCCSIIITSCSFFSFCGGSNKRILPSERPELTFLRAEGRNFVDESSSVVQLRGCNIGTWLLIEPWMLGIEESENLHCEQDIVDILTRRFGKKRTLKLLDTFHDKFFTEGDVAKIASMGMNCIRIPIWWRGVVDPNYGDTGKYLERAVEWCRKYGIYVIIDMHGAPGGQNDNNPITGEKTDNLFWSGSAEQEKVVNWWVSVAERYRDDPVIAGYDILNEASGAPSFESLINFYDKVYSEIRRVDTKHTIIFEDGLLGFHRMPLPDAMGWENVAYSIHYYPQNSAEGYTAPREIFPAFNRSALYYNVPLLIGEFNTFLLERGGSDMFLRYIEVFDYYNWSWTSWCYKKLEDDFNSCWGFYGYYDALPVIDIENGTFAELEEGFRKSATCYSKPNELLIAAVKSRSHIADVSLLDALGSGRRVMLTLDRAFIISSGGAGRGMRMQWAKSIPNVGFWESGKECVAWSVDIEKDGFYDVGISASMQSDKLKRCVQVSVDGMVVLQSNISGGISWESYSEYALGKIFLHRGKHIISFSKGNDVASFINMRYAWLEKSYSSKVATSGRAPVTNIRLNALTMQKPAKGNPLRIEWSNSPPNIGYWKESSLGTWIVNLPEDGYFELEISYSSPSSRTIMQLFVNGKKVIEKLVPRTGGWHRYQRFSLGKLELLKGDTNIGLKWFSTDGPGAGNIRELELIYQR